MAAPRPLSDGNRQWLAGELQAWQDAGLVSAEKAESILKLYEPASVERERQHNYFIISLCGLAALLIGAALALLVSYNWNEISATGKLAIIFGVLLATYGAAAASWRLQYRQLGEVIVFA